MNDSTAPEPDPADALDPLDPANQVWTTAEAAARAHVDQKTVQKWADRGKLTVVGQLDGENLYNGGEVLAVEKATRRTARLAALLAESRALFRRTDTTVKDN